MSKEFNDEELWKDPRVAEAKKLLLEAVQSHQKDFSSVRPPNPALKESYEKLLKTFGEYRAGNLWFPYLGSGLGKGALVQLLDGSVKYDFICGIGPHFFGHSHPEIIAASVDAAISNTVMQGNLQQNKDSFDLSEMLIKHSKFDHCFLSSSGAMANENALKIAFQKRYPATRILAFERCFVGRSLATSQITDKPLYREGLPINFHVDYVPFFDHKAPEESTQRAIAVLKGHLERYPKQHAVMIFELIQGEAGFYAGTRHFFEKLMEILKEHGIMIFDDEVQSFGRTTELFAYQYFNLDKYVDIVSIGKLSQVCATLFTKAAAPKPGLLSQTFTASTSAIRTAKRILEILTSENYYGREGKIAALHQHFASKLEAIEKRHPDLIHGPYGVGCMIAFTPFNGEAQRTTQFAKNLFDAGVLSFTAGANPTRIRFLIPAGAVTNEDIDKAAKIIEETLLKS